MSDPFGVTVKIDARVAQDRLAVFGKKNIDLVQSRAATKTAKGMARPAAALIKARVGMLKTTQEIRPRFRIVAASPVMPVAEFRIGRQEVGLIRFVSGQKPPARRHKIGVPAKIFGVRSLYPGAFFVEVAPGRWQVFRRSGKGRLPIDRLFGPSVAGVARMPEVFAELQRIASDLLGRHLDHEIDRRLRVLTGRAKLSAAAQAKFDRAG